jgi:hypothetical protein
VSPPSPLPASSPPRLSASALTTLLALLLLLLLLLLLPLPPFASPLVNLPSHINNARGECVSPHTIHVSWYT